VGCGIFLGDATVLPDNARLDATARDQRLNDILDIVSSEPSLRSRRDLIEKFIRQSMPELAPSERLEDAFKGYWEAERESAMNALCADEGMQRAQLDNLMQLYEFTGQTPGREDVVGALSVKPRILERRKVIDRIIDRMTSIIRTFDSETGDI
jgi:type I restriction enzyme R subunit